MFQLGILESCLLKPTSLGIKDVICYYIFFCMLYFTGVDLWYTITRVFQTQYFTIWIIYYTIINFGIGCYLYLSTWKNVTFTEPQDSKSPGFFHIYLSCLASMISLSGHLSGSIFILNISEYSFQTSLSEGWYYKYLKPLIQC